MWLQLGSVKGTQRILLSSAFSSRMRNSATGLTSMRQPGNVGSGADIMTASLVGAAGKRRLGADDHDVQRVAVGGDRVLEEPVVRRVAQRGKQQPVELDR